MITMMPMLDCLLLLI